MISKRWIAGAFALALAAPAFADGDVSVVVDPVTHELQVTGDASANGISITYDGVPGSYTVTGTTLTTVNGAASASVTNAKSFFISMGDGADAVNLTDVPVRGKLRVLLGGGADVLVMDAVRERGHVVIRGGDGDDRIVAQNHCVFGGAVTIRGESGHDVVEIRDSACLQRVVVDTGEGDDQVTLENSTFDGHADVEVYGRNADDTLDVNDCTFHVDVKVDMGGDDDHVTLDNSNFSKDVKVSGGGGNDDNLSVHSGNNFKHGPKFRSFES